MTPLQLELTKLIGKKELSFGCLAYAKEENTEHTILYVVKNEIVTLEEQTGGKDVFYDGELEIIGHPATLSDFHRWMNEKFDWQQKGSCIWFSDFHDSEVEMKYIEYDSSKELLEQSEETLQQIINLISNNK